MKEYGLVYENVSLKDYNTYKIGGKARYLIKPFKNKLGDLLNYLEKHNLKWYLLGKGSNVILPDEDFSGAIILLDNYNDFAINDDIAYVEAGMPLSSFIKKTLDNGYTNFAPLMGIPGTIGSAIVGNVGSFGKDIFSNLIDVTIYRAKKIIVLKKEEIEYNYRHTEFKNSKDIIISAHFSLQKGNVKEALTEIASNLKKRKMTQPLGTKNAGSVFKNPLNDSAGRIIEELGLKGKSIGGAMVSNKHANFIINENKATSKDIKDLINYIKKEVKNKKNIDLELEQIIVEW